MSIPFYKTDSGAWLVNNKVVAPATCVMTKESNGEVSVSTLGGEKLIRNELVTSIVNGSGTAYTTFDSLVAGTANFFFQVTKKEYTVFLNQTSTSAPVASVLKDDLITAVWARTGTGVYTLTKVGAFPADKTVPLKDTYTDSDGYTYTLVRTSDDIMTLSTYDETDQLSDDILSDQYFHLEVYL